MMSTKTRKLPNYCVLAVIYNETGIQERMAISTLKTIPHYVETIGVSNRLFSIFLKDKFTFFLQNDKNCLSKAWNMGLRYAFNELAYDYVLVTGLDQLYPYEYFQKIEKEIEANKGDRIYAGSPNTPNKQEGTHKITHGDGAFSSFLISKKLFEKIGDFDENFIPAYFEDNDYIEKMLQLDVDGVIDHDNTYHHVVQGTIKTGNEIRKKYPEFMQKNLEYFKKKWGKVPSHLPSDISFL